MGAFLCQYRSFFLYAGIFSFFVNLLLLVPALYTLQVFDRVLLSRHEETLVLLTALTVGALVTMMVLEALRSLLLAQAAIVIDKHLGPRLLGSLLDKARRPGSSQDSNGLRDLASLRSFVAGPAILALFDVPWFAIFLVVIYLFHPLLGTVALLGAAMLLALALLNERLTRKPLEALQRDSRTAGRFVDQGLRNAEIIAALGMVHGIRAAWEALNRQVLDSQATSSSRSARINAATRFVRQLVQVAMLGTGALLVIRLDVSPGVMIAATILLGRALAPMEAMISGWRGLVDARGASERLRAFIESEEDSSRPTRLPAPVGELALQKVVFALKGRESAIIKGVSFHLPAGDALAILGPSGAGKSTLARLMIGVWSPSAGTVRLDDADVSLWQRDVLGPHIGYLPQDVQLFSGTVGLNIRRFGIAGDEAVVAAAKRANAHGMILRLPNGYDTEIGEGGSGISGGQRQRVALARALYGNPRLVVLDEPDANLDEEGDLALMHTIRDLRARAVTLVLVTHRPALVAKMDKVLALRDGAVAFFGPAEEFLAKVVPDDRLRDRSRVNRGRRTSEA